MPVTIVISDIEPESCKLPTFESVTAFLEKSCPVEWRKSQELVRTSFSEEDLPHMRPRRNGFMDTVIDAYSQHHRLVIRPDDVWIAILSQLSFYTEAHAERLRSRFVTQKGKNPILLATSGTRYNVDYGWLADEFSKCLDERILDDTLRDWLLPRFSTTTDVDTVVMAIQMMSVMKGYFSFGLRTRCGIPLVTLDGTKSDWEDLHSRIPTLATFGPECAHWADLLLPLMERFVDAFDGNPDVEFWKRVVHVDHLRSGVTYLCGWITALCPFKTDGDWIDITCEPRKILLSTAKRSIEDSKPVEDSTAPFYDSSGHIVPYNEPDHMFGRIRQKRNGLVLDGREYPVIDISDVPAGYCSVDLDLNDQGEPLHMMLVSGHFACREFGEKRDGVQPEPGWFMCVKGPMKASMWEEKYGSMME